MNLSPNHHKEEVYMEQNCFRECLFEGIGGERDRVRSSGRQRTGASEYKYDNLFSQEKGEVTL